MYPIKVQQSLHLHSNSGEVAHLWLIEPPANPQPCHRSADQERVAQILYLLDQFAISNETYHELASISDDLPPSYKVKKKRMEINEAVDIVRVTGSVSEGTGH